jgi:D-alanyl-D-alanine carboxypeptidase
MTAVTAAVGEWGRHIRAAKGRAGRRPLHAGWLGACVQAVAGFAAVLMAASACGGKPGPHAPRTAPASGGAAVISPGAGANSALPRSPKAAPMPTARTTSPSAHPVAFTGGASVLDAATRSRMTGVSWRPGCPVPLADLRLLRLSYWGFDGQVVHQGELIVNADAVSAMLTAFRLLFDARYPIHRMRPVEVYGGSDERSMLADNTSAFNCRGVPGSTAWSQHAYGRAVDINPFENPEVRGSQIDPPAASAWADRSRTGPAVIHHGDAAWRAFAAVGWTWGGDWSYPLDYMHFSANGL